MLLKDFFISLSQNQLLNSAAKKYGLKLGAQHVVAGTNIEETIETIKELNAHGISCTVDNLGEFVFKEEEALEAKEEILALIEAIHEHGVDAHISLKPSQLGLDIDYNFTFNNLKEIVAKAHDTVFSLTSIWRTMLGFNHHLISLKNSQKTTIILALSSSPIFSALKKI